MMKLTPTMQAMTQAPQIRSSIPYMAPTSQGADMSGAADMAKMAMRPQQPGIMGEPNIYGGQGPANIVPDANGIVGPGAQAPNPNGITNQLFQTPGLQQLGISSGPDMKDAISKMLMNGGAFGGQ